MANKVIYIADALPGILEKRIAMSRALVSTVSEHSMWKNYESAYRAALAGLRGKSLYRAMVIIARLNRMDKGFSLYKDLWSTLLPEKWDRRKYRLEREREHANHKIITQLGRTGMNETE